MDRRGWILACASGVACVIGSSIICLDLVCRCVPRWRDFNVRKSTTFLAASLSLSFGVMFFSSLYGMLPKARQYLVEGGLSPSFASAVLITTFLAGVLGLQLVSEFLHYCLPSSIVNCDEHGKEYDYSPEDDRLEIPFGHPHTTPQQRDERAPLLNRESSIASKISVSVTSLVKGCGEGGKCYGFSDHDCGQKCLTERQKLLERQQINSTGGSGSLADIEEGLHQPYGSIGDGHHGHHHHNHNHHNHSHPHNPTTADLAGHHHVANNKFLSIGVQTSIAIAIHKIPEGFITYATNHANPQLGFAVFLAIFIHNIAEGFAIALPLFLALKSRLWAIVWASLLGGASQPLGAALAALSMKDSENDLNNHRRAYGVLFAVTAGIMCSVGLQLFSQAIQIHHGHRLPFIFGFVGMGLLGVSFALTA